MSGDKLPIVEADEIAAEKVLDALLVATEPEMLSPEECEAEIVQAFARHRIAAETKAATTITELVSALEKARAMLDRYRNETPLGNQPHMIAHKADDLLADIDALLSNTRGDKNEQE